MLLAMAFGFRPYPHVAIIFFFVGYISLTKYRSKDFYWTLFIYFLISVIYFHQYARLPGPSLIVSNDFFAFLPVLLPVFALSINYKEVLRGKEILKPIGVVIGLTIAAVFIGWYGYTFAPSYTPYQPYKELPKNIVCYYRNTGGTGGGSYPSYTFYRLIMGEVYFENSGSCFEP